MNNIRDFVVIERTGNRAKLHSLGMAVAIAFAFPVTSQAYELYESGETVISADLGAGFGVFHSGENYQIVGNRTAGSSTWREGYIEAGLSGSQGLNGRGTVYGAVSVLGSGTWGDGDPAGLTVGTERRVALEEAHIGWRSDSYFPALGDNWLDVSVGRQNVVLGDGFLINGDLVSFGDADLGANFDRGGAYYLAPRKAFDQTAVVRLGGTDGWRSDLAWVKSDNRAQAETELAAGTVEYVGTRGVLGLTWVHGLDVNEQFASPAQLQRDGMDTVSLRGMGGLGIENLNLAFEFAAQDKDSGSENAWYLEGSWTFADKPWQPTATYRFSRFSEGFDPLFYGASRGFGTWYQGEVAANYAGPFSSNTSVHHAGFKATPSESLTVGALGFVFETLDEAQGDLSGRELDLYAEWAVNEHLFLIPLVGIYQPEHSAANGGVQLGSDSTNVYAQLLAITFF